MIPSNGGQFTPPPELDIGQDDEPPDVGLAILVALLLLKDIDQHFRLRDGDEEDLRLRIGSLLKVLTYIHERQTDGSQ